MKTLFSKLNLGVLALLCSSVGMASQVTITSDASFFDIASNTYRVPLGSTFHMTISSDVQNTFGAATLRLAFDANKVIYASGTFLAPFNFYSKVSANNATPTDFYVEAPSSPTGTYNVAVLTFNALVKGAANIVIDDDNCVSGGFGWPDNAGGCVAGITYNQARVEVVTPIPAAVWLFTSALGVMGVMRRKISS